ncbi:MAG: Mth938-like domain-containing protein [Nitrococcus mobilis]|nr:Mth938-like domain-containing protein [Nitrococcus mobilis]
MKMILETGDVTAYRIKSYEPGRVTINEWVIETSAIVTPNRLLRGWPPRYFGDLERAHMEAIIDLAPEIVLLGTGPQQHFPPRNIMLSLLERGIGLEIMDTPSACRTYNILMSEGRRVVAALIIR